MFSNPPLPATCPYSEPDQSRPCPLDQFLKTHFNIILPFKPGAFKWSLFFRFPHQHPVCTAPLRHTCYRPSTSLSFLIDHPNNNWWGVFLNSSLYIYLDSLVTSSHSTPNILKIPQSTFLPQCEISTLSSFVLCSKYLKIRRIFVTIFFLSF